MNQPLRINHDRLFKELLSTFFIEFLELFFPQVVEYIDQQSIQPAEKEEVMEIVTSWMEQGIEQGKLEERKEMIAKLLASGMTLEQISEITNFSVEYLKKLLD
jgi:DNA-binding NarL/FixJ family response regulator